jgi:dihydrolipoamide dehydrogenase
MKLVVLGGGPAGYVAALRAAQLGAHCVLVEARDIGGTCLNRGCIPTKAMVASAERLRQAREAAAFGIQVGEASVDFAALMRRKDEVVAHERAGVEHLLKVRKVEVVAGRGRLIDPRRVRVEPTDGSAGGAGGAQSGADAGEPLEIEGDALVLASGSEPMRLPVFDFSDPRLYTSDEILAIDRVPGVYALMGIPSAAIDYFVHPADYDTAEADAALAGAGVRVPPFRSYAGRLVDFVRAHPELSAAAMA